MDTRESNCDSYEAFAIARIKQHGCNCSTSTILGKLSRGKIDAFEQSCEIFGEGLGRAHSRQGHQRGAMASAFGGSSLRTRPGRHLIFAITSISSHPSTSSQGSLSLNHFTGRQQPALRHITSTNYSSVSPSINMTKNRVCARRMRRPNP